MLFCFTILDLKNEGCKALCQRDGYHGGKMAHKDCVCYEAKGKYEDFKYRRVKVPKVWPEPEDKRIPYQYKEE